MQDALKYLQPEVVAQLANMELRARLVVEGFITGLHKSPYHGFSVEFTEHRPYMPGDEIKHIDWKAYGKTDRYYIKEFEEETNLKSYLVLDASKSMEYASPGNIRKIEYASYIAAALGYLMVEQRDAVGLSVYDERVRTHFRRGQPSSICSRFFASWRISSRETIQARLNACTKSQKGSNAEGSLLSSAICSMTLPVWLLR